MSTKLIANEIRGLTGLRGVAATLVAWGHFHNEFPAPSRITLWVDLFFMLSGFVIARAYSGKVKSLGEILRFLVLRLGRIYPVHIFTFALAILAFGYANAMRGLPLFYWRDTPIGLLENLALIQAWPPWGAYSWNMPAWSISAEWAAYLAFPAFAYLRRSLAGAFIIPVCLGWIAFYIYRHGTNFGAGWQTGLWRCLLGFPLGMWLASVKVPKLVGSNAVGFAAGALLGCVWIFDLPDWLVVPPMALLILHLSVARGLLQRSLSSGPLYGLGLISYSLYMCHYPVYKMWQAYYRKTFHGGMTGAETLFFGLLLTAIVLLLSYAIWRLVEEPARIASRRFVNGGFLLPRRPSAIFGNSFGKTSSNSKRDLG
ncbi:MAG: acyltransferase family protein [Alphaproteobacteria bacterium]|nr:acyltransferase family protein [Alphaproteobacteria bacterium]